MYRHLPTIESIKENIKYLNGFIGENTLVMPQAETITDKRKFDLEIEKTPYYEFIVYADYHYFISRILFMNSLTLYSFFSGQQCIENYLKAYIRFRNKIPKTSHCLSDLLSICKELSTENEDFLFSDDILTILYKYEPFNEMPRYPVSKTRTNGYIWSYPEDIYILDYFVYKFREIMPFPDGNQDILKEENFYINFCKRDSPLLYNCFLDRNINFLISNRNNIS